MPKEAHHYAPGTVAIVLSVVAYYVHIKAIVGDFKVTWPKILANLANIMQNCLASD